MWQHMTDRSAELTIGDQQLELPIIEPTIGNDGLGISTLRNTTGDVTFDPGFANTAGTRSSITYINGAEGILRHRGYSIEDLALNTEFLEVAYLLLFGELPNQQQLTQWNTDIAGHALVKEEMKRFFDAFPPMRTRWRSWRRRRMRFPPSTRSTTIHPMKTP